MTDMMERDPVELLAGYRPTQAQLDSEFGPARRAVVRTALLTAPPSRALRWRALRPRRVVSATVASAIAVAALIVGIVVALVPGGGTAKPSHSRAPQVPGTAVGTPFVDTPVVAAGQFAYRATTNYQVDASGTMTAQSKYETWVAPDGSAWDRSSGNANRGDDFCAHRTAPQSADFETPTSAFFAAMPTNPGALESYLRSHVNGSSSQDEALFVAAGDMLRQADLLAPSQLRAALVTVLSGISGMTVHTGVTDARGRPVVRVDWVNQALRPGDLSALYFDASTYQLLEERDGASGGPSSYNGPSPAYTAHESDPAPTAEQLPNPANVEVVTAESVADSVPSDVLDCAAAGR